MSCDPFFIFSIDGHKLTIIEVDGINVEPLLVDSIPIFSGQRYSFILEANMDVNNYWIRADPPLRPGETAPDPSSGINTAILRYSGAPTVDPTTDKTDSTMPLAETDLHPLENPGAPGEPRIGGADVEINLDMGFDPVAGRFLINNASFTPPSVPVLLQILSGASQASELLPNGSVYSLPPNKVIEISMPPGRAPGAPVSVHIIAYIAPLIYAFAFSAPFPSSRCEFVSCEIITILANCLIHSTHLMLLEVRGVPSSIMSILFVGMLFRRAFQATT